MASARAGSALIPPPHNIRASRADRDSPIASVNVVEIAVSCLVATDHAAAVAIWVGVVSVAGGVISAIASVCI
jgi:hypothetical protein